MRIKAKYISCLFALLTFMSACTEEKTFVIDGVGYGNVNFVIENMQFGERGIASSVIYEGYRYVPVGYGDTFDMYVFSKDNPAEGGYYSYLKDGENVVIAGGNNELQLRFTPQCPEEVSAHFTMPWGKEYDLTANDSVVNILINRNLMREPMNQDLISNYYGRDYLVVKAESRYKKGNMTYINSGYVLIDIEAGLEYVGSEGKWFYNYWQENSLELRGNCNFFARNLSVGDPDYASTVFYPGYDYYYPQGYYRNDYFTLPIYHINDDGTKTYTGNVFDVSMEYENLLWCGMNNEISFTFRPSDENETEAKLIFPDGSAAYATASDSIYVWPVPNDIVSKAGRNPIVVETQSEYEKGGIKHFNSGYMLIEVNDGMYYDKSDGTWFRRQ